MTEYTILWNISHFFTKNFLLQKSLILEKINLLEANLCFL